MRKVFFRCSRCGKKLIERLPNGYWKFCFGRNRQDDDDDLPIMDPIIDMTIYGSVKIKCYRRSCRAGFPDHVNQFDFVPQFGSPEQKAILVNQQKAE